MKLKFYEIVLVALYILLVLFQIKTTNIKTAYQLTPAEIDFQIQRMNMFPPSLARLGYIMEVRKESRIFEKVQNNFFTVVDFKEYFPNRIPYIVSPFVFIGLYLFVVQRNRWRVVFYSFFLSILILTVIGSNAKYGPILMFPYFAFFVFLCLSWIYKLFKK